jgi:transposase InsO family protein
LIRAAERYLFKKKSDAGGALRDSIVKFERDHDCLVKSVHVDNAAEFTGNDFNSCLREQGIKFTSSAPYSSESNGLAKKINKVLFACVRCLLDYFGMDKVMWGEAAHHAVYLLMFCVAKDETSVNIMCRRVCCNFLWKSRLRQIWLARRLTPDVSAVCIYIYIYRHIYV